MLELREGHYVKAIINFEFHYKMEEARIDREKFEVF